MGEARLEEAWPSISRALAGFAKPNCFEMRSGKARSAGESGSPKSPPGRNEPAESPGRLSESGDDGDSLSNYGSSSYIRAWLLRNTGLTD